VGIDSGSLVLESVSLALLVLVRVSKLLVRVLVGCATPDGCPCPPLGKAMPEPDGKWWGNPVPVGLGMWEDVVQSSSTSSRSESERLTLVSRGVGLGLP
jgi:hypothetical protein